MYKTFEKLIEAKGLTGRVITHVPHIPDLSLFDRFKARTFGDLSHLDPKKQLLHQKLSSTSQLDALYQFEYYSDPIWIVKSDAPGISFHKAHSFHK